MGHKFAFVSLKIESGDIKMRYDYLMIALACSGETFDPLACSKV